MCGTRRYIDRLTERTSILVICEERMMTVMKQIFDAPFAEWDTRSATRLIDEHTLDSISLDCMVRSSTRGPARAFLRICVYRTQSIPQTDSKGFIGEGGTTTW